MARCKESQGLSGMAHLSWNYHLRSDSCRITCSAGPAVSVSLTAMQATPTGQWMVDILALVLQHDEQAVLTAVELALTEGVPTKTHVLNLLSAKSGHQSQIKSS